MGFREEHLYRKHLYILTQQEEERERYMSDSSKKGKGEQERNVRMKKYSLVKVVPCQKISFDPWN